MVLKNYRTLTQTQVWDGTSQTITTNLPRDFLIQRIILDVNNPSIACTGTSVLVQDPFLKCIDNIKITAVGEGSSREIFSVSGKDLYAMNMFDYGSSPQDLTVVSTTTAGITHTGFVIDFRTNRLDPDDMSTALPSYLLSTLQLSITYLVPSATTWGTNFPTTLGTTTTTISLIEGIPEANEDFSSNPLLTTLTKTLTGDTTTGTDETFDTFFQVGALIKRAFLCTETSAGVRSDTEIDTFTVNSGTIPLMSKIQFRANKCNDIVNYRIAEDASGNYTSLGYTMISFANNRMPFVNAGGSLRIGGLSTVGYTTSDLPILINKNNASSIMRRIQETIES
mgnify:CR=1 FL=1